MLKRVSIQNFKSLKDVTLDLQKVNLLIGPNNSGKTNFLKALNYMASFNANRSEVNFSNIVYQKNVDNVIIIMLDYDSIDVSYTFKCFIDKVNVITKSIIDPQKQTVIDAKSYGYYDSNLFKNLIGSLYFYRIDPNKLIKPGAIGLNDQMLKYDISNIVNFLDLMLGKYRRTAFNQIELDLERCIPEFNEVNLDNTHVTEELKKNFSEDKSFKKIGLSNNKQNIIYWADELSEGTLYFLALLCIINQPDPPKILLLEEPEKGIHPRRIREVMDLIFKLAEEKDIQVIMTTHNEHVLDEFATRPEGVFVFDKDEEGATYVRNLQTDIIEPTNKRNEELGLDPIDLTTNLSENWLYGLLGGVPPIAE